MGTLAEDTGRGHMRWTQAEDTCKGHKQLPQAEDMTPIDDTNRAHRQGTQV